MIAFGNLLGGQKLDNENIELTDEERKEIFRKYYRDMLDIHYQTREKMYFNNDWGTEVE